MSNNKKLYVPPLKPLDIDYYITWNSELKPPRVFTPHVHNTLEFYVHLEGDASFMVEQNLYRLQAGDIVVSRPNEVHNCILNSLSTHKNACLWLPVENDFLFGELLTGRQPICHVISPPDEEKQLLLSLYNELEQATQEKDQRRRFYVIMSILRIYVKNVRQDGPTQNLPTVLKDILSDIALHLQDIHSLSYFSDKYFVSPSTLSRMFKKYLHTSPKSYLDAKRLAHSRILLLQGKSVLDAGKLSGFADCSHYIRLFKKHFGITPNTYKKG